MLVMHLRPIRECPFSDSRRESRRCRPLAERAAWWASIASLSRLLALGPRPYRAAQINLTAVSLDRDAACVATSSNFAGEIRRADTMAVDHFPAIPASEYTKPLGKTA